MDTCALYYHFWALYCSAEEYVNKRVRQDDRDRPNTLFESLGILVVMMVR